MKSHMHIVIISTLVLSGCGTVPGSYSGVSKPSDTVYVRDTSGSTIYRIQDGNIYKPNGTRVGKIGKK
jgi:starvation-inducible outer membrane lipoprotein